MRPHGSGTGSGWTTEGWFPREAGTVISSPVYSDQLGVHAISYTTRIHCSLLVVKRPGRDAVHSPRSRAETHAARISTSGRDAYGDFSVSGSVMLTGVPSSTHKAYFLTGYAVRPTHLLLLFKH